MQPYHFGGCYRIIFETSNGALKTKKNRNQPKTEEILTKATKKQKNSLKINQKPKKIHAIEQKKSKKCIEFNKKNRKKYVEINQNLNYMLSSFKNVLPRLSMVANYGAPIVYFGFDPTNFRQVVFTTVQGLEGRS